MKSKLAAAFMTMLVVGFPTAGRTEPPKPAPSETTKPKENTAPDKVEAPATPAPTPAPHPKPHPKPRPAR